MDLYALSKDIFLMLIGGGVTYVVTRISGDRSKVQYQCKEPLTFDTGEKNSYREILVRNRVTKPGTFRGII